METFFKAIGIGVVVLLSIVALAALSAFPTMWAWNYVIPYLFHLKTLNVLQALCLNWLALTFFHSTLTCKK